MPDLHHTNETHSGRLPDAHGSALESAAEEYIAAAENYTQALGASWQATLCYGVNSAEEVASGSRVIPALYRVTAAKTRLKHAVSEVCRSATNDKVLHPKTPDLSPGALQTGARNGTCVCPCSTGWTTVKCCNLCGQPTHSQIWPIPALEHARELLSDICRGEVNPEDEAEKWLRAYGWPTKESAMSENNDKAEPPSSPGGCAPVSLLAAGDALLRALAATQHGIGCGCGGDHGLCNRCSKANAEADEAAEAWESAKKAANRQR